MNKTRLTNKDVEKLAAHIATLIASEFLPSVPIRVYGVPRGGIPVSYLLAKYPRFELAAKPEEADVLVDDLIDSGSTADRWIARYPDKSFFVLLDKRNVHSLCNSPLALDLIRARSWVVFPWENEEPESEDDSIVATLTNRIKAHDGSFLANDNISAFVRKEELSVLQVEVQRRAEYFLRGLIVDVDNDHNMRKTAERLAKMYLHETFSGRYLPAPTVTDFPNAKKLDELYTTGPITVRSTCSHHLAPIIGRCWVGVVPGERVIGLSKFNRVVDWFCSRGQIQEELVVQIADYLTSILHPKGLAVIIKATHTCMTHRGVKESSGAVMTTSVMRGALRDRPEARAEFMALIEE